MKINTKNGLNITILLLIVALLSISINAAANETQNTSTLNNTKLAASTSSVASTDFTISPNFQIIKKGQNNITLYSNKISFERIEVMSNTEKANVTFQIKKTSTSQTKYSGIVYEYVYTSTNSPAIIDSIKIFYKISTEWIKNNSLNTNDLRIYIYNNSWQQLDSQLINNNSLYYYYSVKVPSMGLFVIAKKSPQNTTQTPSTKSTSQSNNQQNAQMQLGTNITKNSQALSQKTWNMDSRLLAAIILIIIILIVAKISYTKIKSRPVGQHEHTHRKFDYNYSTKEEEKDYIESEFKEFKK